MESNEFKNGWVSFLLVFYLAFLSLWCFDNPICFQEKKLPRRVLILRRGIVEEIF